MSTFIRSLCALVTGTLAIVCSGCSSGKASATGKVSLNGEPVKNGTITFYDKDGVGTSSVLDADGGYRIEGLPPGTLKVTLSRPPAGSTAPAKAVDRGVRSGTEPKGPERLPAPDKYESPTTSGVTVQLKPGSNELDITFK